MLQKRPWKAAMGSLSFTNEGKVKRLQKQVKVSEIENIVLSMGPNFICKVVGAEVHMLSCIWIQTDDHGTIYDFTNN